MVSWRNMVLCSIHVYTNFCLCEVYRSTEGVKNCLLSEAVTLAISSEALKVELSCYAFTIIVPLFQFLSLTTELVQASRTNFATNFTKVSWLYLFSQIHVDLEPEPGRGGEAGMETREGSTDRQKRQRTDALSLSVRTGDLRLGDGRVWWSRYVDM